MDNLRRLATVLCLAFLSLLGARGLLLQIPWSFPQTIDMVIRAEIPAWVESLTWLAAVGIPIGLLVEAITSGGGRALLELKGRDGAVILLRQSVIVKIVQECVSELPEVEKLDVKAKAGRKGLRLYIGVAAKAVTTVGNLEEAIRGRVDQGLREILGIQEIAGIEIRLDDISLSGRAKPPGEPPKPTPMPPARAPLVDRDDSPAPLAPLEQTDQAEESDQADQTGQADQTPSDGEDGEIRDVVEDAEDVEDSEEGASIDTPEPGEDSDPPGRDSPSVTP